MASIYDEAVAGKAEALKLPNSNQNRPMRQNIIDHFDAIIAQSAPTPTPPTLTKFEIVPGTFNLLTNQGQQFGVKATWSDGSVSIPTATWSASVGTITTSGYWSGSAVAGTVQIHAETPDHITALSTGTITAPVPPPTPTLENLIINPATVTVAPNTSQQFTAAAQWSDGSTTVPSLVWTATAGAITTDGKWLGSSVIGTHTITARASDKTATATATVEAPIPPPSGTHEPAGMIAKVRQPFDTLTIPGFTHYEGGTVIVVDSGSNVARVVNKAGVYSGNGAKWESAAVGNSYQKMYQRLRFKPQTDWRCHSNGYKIFYPVFWSDNAAQHEHGVILELRVGAPDGITGPIRCRFLPQSALGGQSLTQNMSIIDIIRGQYNLLEALFVLNTAGQLNGLVQWWINGTLAGEYPNVGFASASETNPRWSQSRLIPYGGGGPDPVPLAADQYLYFDEFSMSVG